MRRRALLSQSGKKLFVIDIDKYMTMEALSGGLKAKLTVSACQYCVDGDGDWKDLPADTFTEFVEEGHFLSFKATLTPDSTNGIGTFITADDVVYQFNLRGNCMAMSYGDDADSYTTPPNNAYRSLFVNNAGLIEVSENFLPATSIPSVAYCELFMNCTSLIKAPALPATKITGSSACQRMFQGCTSLQTPPSLPATTLGTYCYYHMFNGCSALTTAPELPATSLQIYCYAYMFYNCSSLISAPALPATTLKDCCYWYMFRGCSKITSITLPATKVVTSCYNRMLYNCSKLNYIKALFKDLPEGSSALTQWVYGVAKTGTFVKAADATWDVTGTSGVPEGWTVVGGVSKSLTIEAVSDLSVSMINMSSSGTYQYKIDDGTWATWGGDALAISANSKLYFKGNDLAISTSNGVGRFVIDGQFNLSGNCLSLIQGDDMDSQATVPAFAFRMLFYGCTGLIKVAKTFLPSMTLQNGVYQYMFYGCTSLTDAPDLPATTLGNHAYYCMFQKCSSLVTIPATLPATQLANYCYANMFNGCSNITTAPVLPALTLVNNCYRYMFLGCSKLTYIKAMFTTVPTTTYTMGWVNNVAASGTFVKNSAATWDVVDTYGVPSGWTIQTATA